MCIICRVYAKCIHRKLAKQQMAEFWQKQVVLYLEQRSVTFSSHDPMKITGTQWTANQSAEPEKALSPTSHLQEGLATCMIGNQTQSKLGLIFI